MAERLGVRVVPKSDLEDQSVSGYLHVSANGEQPIIVYNSNHPETRQRFTIAHEIAHFKLHQSRRLHVDDLETTDLVLYRDEHASRATHLIEIAANQFAAELLMPAHRIHEGVEKLRTNDKGMSELVSELATRFGVSQTAMAIRLNALKVAG